MPPVSASEQQRNVQRHSPSSSLHSYHKPSQTAPYGSLTLCLPWGEGFAYLTDGMATYSEDRDVPVVATSTRRLHHGCMPGQRCRGGLLGSCYQPNYETLSASKASKAACDPSAQLIQLRARPTRGGHTCLKIVHAQEVPLLHARAAAGSHTVAFYLIGCQSRVRTFCYANLTWGSANKRRACGEDVHVQEAPLLHAKSPVK